MNTSIELIIQLESGEWAHVHTDVNALPALILEAGRSISKRKMMHPAIPWDEETFPYSVTDSADPKWDTEFTLTCIDKEWVCRERSGPTREVSQQVV